MIMNWWWNLQQGIEKHLIGVVEPEEWDLTVTNLNKRIKELQTGTNEEELIKESFERRYAEYIDLSKVRPRDRSPFYGLMR